MKYSPFDIKRIFSDFNFLKSIFKASFKSYYFAFESILSYPVPVMADEI